MSRAFSGINHYHSVVEKKKKITSQLKGEILWKDFINVI